MATPSGRAYTPNSDVLQKISRVNFVAVVGPTAAGKSTLIQQAVSKEPRLHLVVASTSRAPRPGEQAGQEFHFCSRPQMQQRISHGQYVQVAPSLFGDLYATAPEDYTANGTCVMPVLAAAVDNFRALPFKQVRVLYVIPPSWEVWQHRAQGRNALDARMREAQSSLQFALHDKNTQLIINNDIAVASKDLITLALGKPMTARMHADQTAGRQLIRQLLANL